MIVSIYINYLRIHINIYFMIQNKTLLKLKYGLIKSMKSDNYNNSFKYNINKIQLNTILSDVFFWLYIIYISAKYFIKFSSMIIELYIIYNIYVGNINIIELYSNLFNNPVVVLN